MRHFVAYVGVGPEPRYRERWEERKGWGCLVEWSRNMMDNIIEIDWLPRVSVAVQLDKIPNERYRNQNDSKGHSLLRFQ